MGQKRWCHPFWPLAPNNLFNIFWWVLFIFLVAFAWFPVSRRPCDFVNQEKHQQCIKKETHATNVVNGRGCNILNSCTFYHWAWDGNSCMVASGYIEISSSFPRLGHRIPGENRGEVVSFSFFLRCRDPDLGHQWRKGYLRPLQLLTPTLVWEALRSLTVSSLFFCPLSTPPPGWEIVISIALERCSWCHSSIG